jgi:hypothetical protein
MQAVAPLKQSTQAHGPIIPSELRASITFVKKRTLDNLPADVVNAMSRYSDRWINWLAQWSINPREHDESNMKDILLGYADFVHRAGFCKGPRKHITSVKLKNVDTHLKAAAVHLQSVGFDDIRYAVRSTRGAAKPKFFDDLQRFRTEISRNEAPVASAVPLNQHVFRNIYEAAVRLKNDPKKRRTLLLLCVSFGYMLRSQNLVKTGKGHDKKIRLENVMATNKSQTILQHGTFSKLPLSDSNQITLMIQQQKNNTKNEPRSRAGAFFLDPLVTLLEDMKEDEASGARYLSEYKVGSTWSIVTNTYLSECLREFAKSQGLVLRTGRRLSSHSCRASGAALLIELGYDHATIMLLGNWKSLNGLRSYLESLSVKFLEEIGTKADFAAPSHNMRVQYPEDFRKPSSPSHSTSSASLVRQAETTAAKPPSTASSIESSQGASQGEDVSAQSRQSTGNARRKTLDFPPSPSSSLSSDVTSNNYDQAATMTTEEQWENMSDLEDEHFTPQDGLDNQAPSESPTNTLATTNHASNSPQICDRTSFLENGVSIIRRSGRNNQIARKKYSEGEDPLIYNEINPPLEAFHHLPASTKDFPNKIGDRLMAIFINKERTQTFWHTGVVMGAASEASETNAAGIKCNVDVLWNNEVQHEVQLLLKDYISTKTFNNLKSSRFPTLQSRALWCWISQDKLQ